MSGTAEGTRSFLRLPNRGVDREVLTLVQRSCGPGADFHRKKAFIGVKSRQLVKYLICEAL
jgi:hypothetical protein